MEIALRHIPFFDEVVRSASYKAYKILGSQCEISTYLRLDNTLTEKLLNIDDVIFRNEIWYNSEVLMNKAQQKNFVCFILSVNNEPSSFILGYEKSDEEESYLIDELVTTIDNEIIRKIMMTLMLVYCHDLGYRSVNIYTNEKGNNGVYSKRFFESFGFAVIKRRLDSGLKMNYIILEDKLANLYKNTILSKAEFPLTKRLTNRF
jgi:hypothetical protein